MSFDSLQLPPRLIVDLYEKSLMSPVNPESRPAPDASHKQSEAILPTPDPQRPGHEQSSPLNEAYRFLGSNSRHILIIVDEPEQAFLSDPHLQLLTKMLEACKLHLGDVAIVNNAVKAARIEALRSQLNSQIILLFGVSPADAGMPIAFPPFRLQDYAGARFLYAPGLDEIDQPTEEARLLKSKLWLCLKQIFNIA